MPEDPEDQWNDDDIQARDEPCISGSRRYQSSLLKGNRSIKGKSRQEYIYNI